MTGSKNEQVVLGALCFLDAPLWALAGAWGGYVSVLMATLWLVAVVVAMAVSKKGDAG